MDQRTKRRTGRNHKSNRKADGLGKFECLEPRLLLYATTGGVWPHPELITVSFMPDGTDIGGAPSALFSTMNAKWSTTTWQKEILRSIQSWAANANLNFSVVPDDGSPFGSAGFTGTDNNVQGDKNFGDIRIGGFAMQGYLGVGMLPPPINNDTTAGDFFLDTSASWSLSSDYNLFTVSAHEAGHGLGLDHSTNATAVMYWAYTGTKSSLTSDDIQGIRAIYGTRPADRFDAVKSNTDRASATDLSPSIEGNKQINLTGLDITTTSDDDWYKVTILSGAANTMTINLQASGLSLLAPKLSLYSSGGSLLSTISGSYNSTVTLTRAISPGQVYYIVADGADTSAFGTGVYALQVNMGNTALPTISSPDTTTAAIGFGGSAAPMSELLAEGRAHALESSGGLGGDNTAAGHEQLQATVYSTSVGGNDFEGGNWFTQQGTDRASDTDGELLPVRPASKQPLVAGGSAGTAGELPGAPACGKSSGARSIDHLLSQELVDAMLAGYGFVSELSGLEAASSADRAE